MKGDSMLQKDVIDELRWDPQIKEKEIGVATKDGVVTLTGHVETFAELWQVERAVEKVEGVKAIANELTVRLPSGHVRTDADIAHQIVETFKWDVQIPHEGITAQVKEGWVTLDGTVHWFYQKDAASRAVRNLTGVRGVTNVLRVTSPSISAYDVSHRIREALRRRAEREADAISVATTGDIVTLKGKVSSFAERRAVEGVAWSAPGVNEVHDELIVTI